MDVRLMPGMAPAKRLQTGLAMTVVLTTLFSLVVFAPRAAADGLSTPPDGDTSLQSGCTISDLSDRMLSAENGTVSAQTSALWGVAGDGRLRGVVAPGQLVYGDNQAGEDYSDDCDMTLRFQHRVTVGAGSSGLEAGSPVKLAVDISLIGYISADSKMWGSQTAPEVASAFVTAEYMIHGASSDPCELEESCGPLVWYNADGERYYSRYPGDPSDGSTSGHLTWTLATNDGIYEDDSREIDGSRDGNSVVLPAPFTFGPQTATFWTVVGAELSIDARLSLGAYETGDSTAKAVFDNGLSASLIRTAEGGPDGLAIVYGDDAPTDELPVLELPNDMTVEATGPDGAKVLFEASAYDTEDGVLTPECDAVSGHTLPLGDTIVSCVVTDSNGNIDEGTFTVTVVDTTAPVLNLPVTIVVPATSEQGAIVDYVVTATDVVDPNPTVTCSTPSGTVLPVGWWAITCRATDAMGNQSGYENFSVIVEGAGAQLVDLRDYIDGLNLPVGIKTSLRAKVAAARVAVAFGETEFACDTLQSLINQSTAQRGKNLTVEQANNIIADATQIRSVLGCG